MSLAQRLAVKAQRLDKERIGLVRATELDEHVGIIVEAEERVRVRLAQHFAIEAQDFRQ